MALDNNFYDFSAGNSLKEIGKMETEMSKLLKTSQSVVKEINKISNIKINININTDDIQKKITDVSNSVKSLGTDIVGTMSKVNGMLSKFDNNMSPRVNGKGDFSKLKELAASYSFKFMDALLPSDQSNIISGALQGFTAGIATGNPIVAVATTIIGAGAEWALSEIKENTDRRNQRVGFASNILKTYLPKIAMNSLSYAADMEQSKINYENILGKDRGNAFVDKLLETTNKSFYDYYDLDDVAKQMLAVGFGQHGILRIFDAIGNASAARGGGKEDALKMMEALRDMKTNGTVTFDNMDVFEEIGVDAYGILIDAIEITGKTTKATKDELKDLISKGVIPADDAIKHLISGLESRYAGMMYKQKQSFSGLISTIKDSVNQVILGPLGKGFIEGIKPALKGFSEFFGLGTKGFKDLSEQIYNFGAEIGKFAGNAINSFKSIFNKLFSNEEFKNADIPAKILMIYDEIKANIDQWYEKNGDSLFKKIEEFFIQFIGRISKNSDFKNAVQDLWLSISPDADTIMKMLQKMAGFDVKNDDHYIDLFDVINFTKKTYFDIKDGFTNDKSLLHNVKYINTIDNKRRGSDEYVNYNLNAIGLNRVPYDYYPALLHEGEAVLRRTEADNYRNGVGKGVIISKIADTIVVKDETDMYKLADILVSEIEKAGLVYGGVM